MNISHYLYPYSYVSSKSMYGELKRFIKLYVYNTWDLFKHPNSYQKIQFLRVLIDREELNIDRKLFSIDWTWIEQRSTHLVTPRLFSSSFRSIEQKFQPIKNPRTRIFTKKISEPKFSLYSFYKWILFNFILLL